MSKADTSTNWTGPSPNHMIATHTLAHEIITRHNDECPVFGPTELALLKRFVDDPSPASARQILQDCNMVDAPGSEHVGSAAVERGSLAGYVVARSLSRGSEEHGSGGNGTGPALTDDEIKALKTWFDGGEPDERMRGAVETGRTI